MANGRFGSIVGSMLGAWMMTAAGSAEVFFLWLALPALLGAVAIFLLYRLSLRHRSPRGTGCWHLISRKRPRRLQWRLGLMKNP